MENYLEPTVPPDRPPQSLANTTVKSSAARAAPKSSQYEESRPPYIPQFSAATQMLLQRIRTQPRGLNFALAAASSTARGTFAPAAYDDARRRLIADMAKSTAMTMQMPAPAPPMQPPFGLRTPPVSMSAPRPRPVPELAAAPKSVAGPKAKNAGMSIIQRISSGFTASGKVPSTKVPSTAHKPAKKAKTTSNAKVAAHANSSTTAAKAAGKRRAKSQAMGGGPDDSALSSISDTSDPEDAQSAGQKHTLSPQQPHTTTKSGRTVQKPVSYNPALVDAVSGSIHKRRHYGKRSAEQALCKRCTRMHSPHANQMVFCDGCNEGWHQKCHEPKIADEMVSDIGRQWFCGGCVTSRRKKDNNHVSKKARTDTQAKAMAADWDRKESWAGKPAQQKRAYLSTLSQQELVALVMHALETHPDLAVFSAPFMPAPVVAFPCTPAPHDAWANMGLVEDNGDDEVDIDDIDDPIAPPWPKPGITGLTGLYGTLPLEDDDPKYLVDDPGDFESFSLIVFDERGRKVEENGMRVF